MTNETQLVLSLAEELECMGYGVKAEALTTAYEDFDLARRHLEGMAPAKRAALEADWLAGEALHDRSRIEAERREIVGRASL